MFLNHWRRDNAAHSLQLTTDVCVVCTPLSACCTGQDYERAHNEAARQAIDALGESLAGLPSRSHHPRTMTPQQWAPPPQQGYYGQPYGGYPPYYGYPAAGGYGGYPGYGY